MKNKFRRAIPVGVALPLQDMKKKIYGFFMLQFRRNMTQRTALHEVAFYDYQ